MSELDELREKLREPFPPESHSTDDSRGFLLTGLAGAYVVERLNDALGLCGHGWAFSPTHFEINDTWVVVDLVFKWRLPDGEWSEPIPVTGSSRINKGRVGDAKKGAVQDAVKKAASYLDVGHQAYKGLLASAASRQPVRDNGQHKAVSQKKGDKRPPKGNGQDWTWLWSQLFALDVSPEEALEALGLPDLRAWFSGENEGKTMQDLLTAILVAAGKVDPA